MCVVINCCRLRRMQVRPRKSFAEARVLVLGVSGTGKTTLFYNLKLGEVITFIPTIGMLLLWSRPHNR